MNRPCCSKHSIPNKWFPPVSPSFFIIFKVTINPHGSPRINTGSLTRRVPLGGFVNSANFSITNRMRPFDLNASENKWITLIVYLAKNPSIKCFHIQIRLKLFFYVFKAIKMPGYRFRRNIFFYCFRYTLTLKKNHKWKNRNISVKLSIKKIVFTSKSS